MSSTGRYDLVYRFIYKFLLLFLLIPTVGCQIGYLTQGAYHSAKILRARTPITDILKDPSVDQKIKNKILLAVEAKEFAETRLKLKPTENYESFVQLDRPYVSYVVSAAPKNQLKFHTWWFPVIGTVPYKGYYSVEAAKDYAKDLSEDELDTYVRGVSAFSSLGWFDDPLLSSMLHYSEFDLVDTIIHETVHATIYIKDNAKFNERLATFLGQLGTYLFYKEKKQAGDQFLKKIADDSYDQQLFSEFITTELKTLEAWYKNNEQNDTLLTDREQEFQKIQERFSKDILPKLKTKRYKTFATRPLNNAVLLNYRLYMSDLSDFEKLSQKLNQDFTKILAYLKSLEDEGEPEKALKAFIDASV